MSDFLFQSLKLYKFTTILYVLVIVFSLQICWGQETSQNQDGCESLAKEKPSVFISYEREMTEKNEKGQNVQKTLLRLHNNLSCEIAVETNDTMNDETLYRKEVTQQPNGDTFTKYIQNPPKDFELPIFYDIKKSKGKPWKPANYWEDRHLVFEYSIPSGYSAVFQVEGKYFQKRLSISVPFKYSWEDTDELRTFGTISHRVSYVYDLPTGFYKDE